MQKQQVCEQRAARQSLLTAQINLRPQENERSASVSGPENLPFITPQVFLQGPRPCQRTGVEAPWTTSLL